MVDTARARSEAALRRDAILETMAFAAQRFLETPHWEEPIDQVLRRLGESTAVSRVYIFENGTDGEALLWSQLHEWVAAGIEPQIDNPDLQRIAIVAKGFARWAEVLSRGDIIHGLVNEFPESERPLLAEQDILSILIVPIFAAGGWWGSIGFDDCMTDRVWTQIEIDALRAAAGTLGAAIQREEIMERLRVAEEKYRALVEQNPAVIYTQVVDEDDPTVTNTVYISPQADALLGYSAEETLAEPGVWRDQLHPDDRDRVLAEDVRTNATGEPFDMEYRAIARDGRVVWIHDRAEVVRDSEGRPRFWQGFMLDITDRKRAEEQMELALDVEREAARRLRTVDEMKNTFLQAVSHDLRTPLAAILGLAVTLEREDIEFDRTETRELAGRIVANSRKLDRLVNDLLDLDRLARGIIEPKLSATDVGALVREIVEESGLLGDRPVHLDVEPLTVDVDGAKVERIVENLLSNTARHTPAGTNVWIRVRREDGGVVIAVEDEGAGIPEDQLETVFEPFSQGAGAGSHSHGVGVGLALVARFAELHGGRAWVEPRDGGGASFRVFLADGAARPEGSPLS